MEFWFSILMRHVANDWLVVLSIYLGVRPCMSRKGYFLLADETLGKFRYIAATTTAETRAYYEGVF